MSFILSKLTQAVIITYKFLSPSLPTIFLVICYLHKTFFLAFSTSQCMLFRKHQCRLLLLTLCYCTHSLFSYWVTMDSSGYWDGIIQGRIHPTYTRELFSCHEYHSPKNCICIWFSSRQKRPYQICKLERSIPIPHKICKDRNPNNVL